MGMQPISKRIIRVLVVTNRERRRQRSRTGLSLVLRIVGVAVLFSVLGNVLLAGLTIGTAAAGYSAITANLPTPEDVRTASVETFETTKIYDRTGQHVLYEVIDPSAGDRNWISLDNIPDYLIDATVAMEDSSFWTNPGFNVPAQTRKT